MLFLETILWKGASCLNGGKGLFFRREVFFFKLEGAPWWSIGFDGGGVFRKKLLDGGGRQLSDFLVKNVILL